MDSFGKESEKQISSSNISEAIGTYFAKRMEQYSTVGYSKLHDFIPRRIEAVLKINGVVYHFINKQM